MYSPSLDKLSNLCLLQLVEHHPIESLLPIGKIITDTMFTVEFFANMTIENQAMSLLHALENIEFAISRNIFLTFASRQNLNFVLPTGDSVCFHLTRSYVGREILLADDGRLCHLLSIDSLNCIIRDGCDFAGESAALHMALSTTRHEQLSELCHLADHLSPETLNYAIQANHSHLSGMSVAAALSISHWGRALLRHNNGKLVRMLAVDTLNGLITLFDSSYKGCSVAFLLLRYGVTAEFTCIVPKLSSQTLSSVFPPLHPLFPGQCVALFLADVSVSFLFHTWTPMLSAEALNAVAAAGPHRGSSVACRLARYDVEALTRDTHRLGHMLTREPVQSVCHCDGVGGVGGGESLVYWLCAGGQQGLSVLALNDFELVRHISAEVLNAAVCLDKVRGESVAYRLAAGGDMGLTILCQHNYRLLRLVSAEALNRVVVTDDRTGETTALRLLSASVTLPTSYGRIAPGGEHAQAQEGALPIEHLRMVAGGALFAMDDCRLTRLLEPATLSLLVRSGQCAGQSVALWLAIAVAEGEEPTVQSLLSVDEWRLGRAINADVLNAVCGHHGGREGESVAFWLSCSDVGLSLLLLDDCRLGRAVSAYCLRRMVRSGARKGQRMGSVLSQSPQGCLVLNTDGGRLREAMGGVSSLLELCHSNISSACVDYSTLCLGVGVGAVAVLLICIVCVSCGMGRVGSMYILDRCIELCVTIFSPSSEL